MEKSKKVSKRDKVLAHLVSGKELTPLDALSLYGSYRLGAIIFDLRKDGYNIKTDIAKGTRHAIYSLIKSDNKEVFDSKWQYNDLRIEFESEKYYIERKHELQERYSK